MDSDEEEEEEEHEEGLTVLCSVYCTGEPAGVLPGPAALHPGRLRALPVLQLCEPAAVSGASPDHL